jgi:hypothetical protein
MAWPKGVSRKGHLNKDGTTHAKRGSKLKSLPTRTRATNAQATSSTQAATSVAAVATRPTPTGQAFNGWEVKREWKSLLVRANGPWTEFCPACGFPEADGGFCHACGWSKPVVYRS